MRKRLLIASIMLSAIGLIGTGGLALADTIVRYECNIIGQTALEPIGDRDGHLLRSFEYSCVGVDGLLKGGVYTAVTVSEVDGPQMTYHFAGGIHRTAGGLAVGQMLDGTGSVVMQEGKPRAPSSGKMIFKFASGTLAALSGKTFKWATKLIGFNRFEMEFAD